MKKEVSFFKDRRGGVSAKNLIAFYRSLGYTDEQIKAEMLKLKEAQQKMQPDGTCTCPDPKPEVRFFDVPLCRVCKQPRR